MCWTIDAYKYTQCLFVSASAASASPVRASAARAVIVGGVCVLPSANGHRVTFHGQCSDSRWLAEAIQQTDVWIWANTNPISEHQTAQFVAEVL